MEKSLSAAKKMIDKRIQNKTYISNESPKENYSKNYLFTNENIAAYLNQTNLEGKEKALTVLASGDQTFNLISKGILSIDTFDKNGLTSYTALGLKRALIEKYDYNTFCEMINKLQQKDILLEELSEIILNSLTFVDKEYRMFWQELIYYNYKTQIKIPKERQINLFNIMFYKSTLGNCNGNIYLESESEFEKFKTNLKKANITFNHCDAANITENFSGKYDLILLSNILDYMHLNWEFRWDINVLNKYIEDLYSICNNNAEIMLYYVLVNRYAREIFKSNTMINEIENSSIIRVPSIIKKDAEDALILLRK